MKDNLSYLEVPTVQLEDDNKEAQTSYIFCNNPVKALHDKSFQMATMDEAENALSELHLRLTITKPKRERKPDPKSTMVKVTEKRVKAFFEVDYDSQHLTYRRYEPSLEKEALRDGKFLLIFL